MRRLVGTGHDVALTVGVLGPFTVSLNGVPVVIASLIQRNLLGFLALRPGYAPPADEIAEILWPQRRPQSWRNLIHVHVNRLRAVIEPGRDRRGRSRVLVSLNGSYRLELAPQGLDVTRFDHAASQARQASVDGDLPRALVLYEQALACWRGPAFAGGNDNLRQHPAAYALHRRRIDAVIAYADIAFAFERYEQARRRLEELCDDEPLHEALHAKLMLALAGSGEQAAALGVFMRMRARLADQLGVDPGQQMRHAYQRVLGWSSTAHDPGAAVSIAGPVDVLPRQVPTVAAFVGREAELRWLDAVIDQDGTGPMAPPVAIVCGTAGVGKTALVAHWAHRAAACFPDGQLYIDMHGFDPVATPVEPATALRCFLRALGVAPGAIPHDTQEAAALYRSVLAGRRVLVVIDNAHHAEQVRPLLPCAVTCTAVVTSRNRLAGLVAGHGARSLELDVMPSGQAVALLRALLGDRAGDAEQARRLAERCAYLPLALRIVAANLAGRRWLAIDDMIQRLDDGDALSTLSTIDDQRFAMKVALSLSYKSLPAPAQRLFGLLHVIPSPRFGMHTAAAILGETLEPSEQVLDVLCDGHMLVQAQPGRYQMHDLLRQYSRACAIEAQTEAALAEAARRLVDFYCLTVHDAYPLIQNRRNETPRVLHYPPARPLRFPDRDAALEWHDQERETLVAAVKIAAAHGWHEPVWQLADSLFAYFFTRRHWPEWQSVLTLGLHAAQQLGNAMAVARLHNASGVVCKQTGRYREARRHYEAALEKADPVGYPRLVAALHTNLGGLLVQMGDPAAALRHLRIALDDPEHGRQPNFATITYLNYGSALLDLARLSEAAQVLTRAIELAACAGDMIHAGEAHSTLAEVRLLQGDAPAAAEHARCGLELTIRAGDPLGRAAALDMLASCHAATGDLPAALTTWREALDAYRSLAHRLQGPLSNWLNEIAGKTDAIPHDLIERDEQRRRIARTMG